MTRGFTGYGLILITLLCSLICPAISVHHSPWRHAHATFYGGSDASGTMGGACGYGDLYRQGYGEETAALSTALFEGGMTCGACFELRCVDDPQWCVIIDNNKNNVSDDDENWNSNSIVVTATNFCPPNWALPSDGGGWCNPPRPHFDLSMPAFLKIARYQAGIVPVLYRRVPCMKQGGIRFTLNGFAYFNLVLVTNVGGSGVVSEMYVKGSKTGWIRMIRNWGQNWQCNTVLVGQSLSFRVVLSHHHVVSSYNVVPANWQFSQTFEGNQVPSP